MKKLIAPRTNGRVRLRMLDEADLPATLRWRNQEHIRRWFFHSDVLTPEQHEQWWQRYQLRDDDFVFVIEETETLGRPVGQVAVYNIDPVNRRAEFGRLMIGDRDAAGLGLATLATACLIEMAFDLWQLDELYLEVFADNQAALNVYRRNGFTPRDAKDRIVHMVLGRADHRGGVKEGVLPSS